MARQRKIDLEWYGPYALEDTDFSEILYETGVYLVINNSSTYRVNGYQKASSLLYIGEGNLGDRLSKHADGKGNRYIKEALNDGDDLSVFYCFLDKDDAECIEGALLSKYQQRYGEWPYGNGKAGTCRVDQNLLVSGLSILDDFDASDD